MARLALGSIDHDNHSLRVMAKKKKKTPNRKGEDVDGVLDICEVRLRKTGSKGPTVRVGIAEHDARMLDVRNGDRVFVLAGETDNPNQLSGTVAGSVEVSYSTRSPGLPSSSARAPLNPGSIQLAPPSAGDMLFGTPIQPSIPSTPSTPVVPTTPSTPSSSFSFKDFKSTPSTPRTPRTPQQSSPLPKNPLWLVPLDSDLGDYISQRLCRNAKRVVLRSDVPSVLERLVLAHCVGEHLQAGQTLSISFQGKSLDLTIDSIEGDPVDELLREFTGLKLDSVSHVVDAIRASGKGLYRVSYDTEIVIVDGSSNSLKIECKPQQYVAGLDTVLERIRSLLLTPIRFPEAFQGNMKPPRGVLLHGPSGVGKTAICRQLASELGSYFAIEHVDCSELQSQSIIVGQAERALARHFRPVQGKPRLLIVDDIHLICPKRGSSSSATDQLSSTLLALLDGIHTDESISVLACTSNPSVLDVALRRPGRLDSEVEIPIPDDVDSRIQIIKFHIADMGATPPDLDVVAWTVLGKMAKGFNGADCMLSVKESLRCALKRGRTATVSGIRMIQEDLEHGIRSVKPSAIKSITVEIPKVPWTAVGGMDEVKNQLREAINMPLAHSEVYARLKIPPPRGILLYGPPGCSKTMMARALATESEMNFLAVKGPELLSKWLGESERSLASLFRRARMASPAIIFFDEIDAIATKRGSGDSTSTSRLLSQLLTELDGVSTTNQRVIVVGATNRPDLLDTALTRPGRIDRMIYVGVPDLESRKKIFEISLKDRTCAADIDYTVLAGLSDGFSGAEIVAICRDAALLALEASSDPAEVSPRLEMPHMRQAIADMERQITPDMLAFYATFRGSTGMHS